MDPIASNSNVMSEKDIRLLKKSQDLEKQQALSLINSLPDAKLAPASPPGVGRGMDVYA